MFSEILEKNRNNLFEGKSFLLTLIKDKENQENRFRRINVRKIVSLEDIAKLNYSTVYIEIDTSDSLKKLYENIKERGDSKIKISIAEIFLFLVIGKIKNANNIANPKWMALAGNPLNIPKSNMKGKGEAYHSWNNDQIIAI